MWGPGLNVGTQLWNQTDAAPAVKDLDVYVRPHGRKVAITVLDADPCERKDQGAVKGAREGAAYLDLDGGGKPSEEWDRI